MRRQHPTSRSKLRRQKRVEKAKQRASPVAEATTQIQPSWSNKKAAFVGYLTGQGNTSVSIADALDDGTSPETIRRMWKLWELSGDNSEGRRNASIPIPLNSHQRMRLNELAFNENMDGVEFMRKIIVIVLQDKHDLYKAIIDE